MSRNPKITREQALRLSMKLFWARGYNATTMDHVQEAVGLQRGSIYSYFKTKENLFREALDLYQKEIVLDRREQVRQAKTVKKGCELFFTILIEHSLKNRSNPGCLNTNTAAELSVLDSEIGDYARLGLKSWESFWVEIIAKGKKSGEIAENKKSQDLARLIITLTHGINIVSKVNPDRSYLNGIVQSSLSLI